MSTISVETAGQYITWFCTHESLSTPSAPSGAAHPAAATGLVKKRGRPRKFEIRHQEVIDALQEVAKVLDSKGKDGQAIIKGVAKDMNVRNAFRRAVHELKDGRVIKMTHEDKPVKPTKKRPNPPPAFMYFQFTAESLVQLEGDPLYQYARETVLAVDKTTGSIMDGNPPQDPPLAPEFVPVPTLPEAPPASASDEEVWQHETLIGSIYDEYEAKKAEAKTRFDAEVQTCNDRIAIRKTLLDAARSAFDHARAMRGGRDITRYVDMIFRRCGVISIPVRKTGGVYFVHKKDLDFVDAVETFLVKLGGEMQRSDLAPTARTKQTVAEAVDEALAKLVERHAAAVAAFGDKTRKSTMDKAVAEIKETRTRIQSYLDFLKADAVARFEDALGECDHRVRAALVAFQQRKDNEEDEAEAEQEVAAV